MVKANCVVDFVGDPFVMFHAKLQKLKKAISTWSRDTYGNIVQKVASLEDKVKVREIQFELNPSVGNREDLNRVNAELKKYWHL